MVEWRRVYDTTVKKFLLAIGALGVPLLVGLFLLLAQRGDITITGYSHSCDVDGICYLYINFTANVDVFVYTSANWSNPLFTTDKPVREIIFQRSWGTGWRTINLTDGCTGTWCGKSPSDTRPRAEFAYAFRIGKDYQVRMQVQKFTGWENVMFQFANITGIFQDPTIRTAMQNKICEDGRCIVTYAMTPINVKDRYGLYVPYGKVTNFTWEDGYWLLDTMLGNDSINAVIVPYFQYQNGVWYNHQEMETLFPNITFSQITLQGFSAFKFGLNISNIPMDVAEKIEKIGIVIENVDGTPIEGLTIEDSCFNIRDDSLVCFDDLLLDYNISFSDDMLLVDGVTNKTEIFLDPRVVATYENDTGLEVCTSILSLYPTTNWGDWFVVRNYTTGPDISVAMCRFDVTGMNGTVVNANLTVGAEAILLDGATVYPFYGSLDTWGGTWNSWEALAGCNAESFTCAGVVGSDWIHWADADDGENKTYDVADIVQYYSINDYDNNLTFLFRTNDSTEFYTEGGFYGKFSWNPPVLVIEYDESSSPRAAAYDGAGVNDTSPEILETIDVHAHWTPGSEAMWGCELQWNASGSYVIKDIVLNDSDNWCNFTVNIPTANEGDYIGFNITGNTTFNARNSTGVFAIGVEQHAPFAITLQSPTDGGNTTNDWFWFNYTPMDNADSSLTCWYTIDGTVTYDAQVTNNTMHGSKISGLTVGWHRINATCQDDVPLNLTSSSVIHYTDNFAPNYTFIDPTPGNGTYQTNNSVYINMTISDTSPISAILLEWNNGTLANFSMSQEGDFWGYNMTNIVSDTIDSANWYKVYVNDTIGNMNITKSRIVYLDYHAPTWSGITQDVAGNPDSREDIFTNVTWDDISNLTYVLFESNYTGSFENYTLTIDGVEGASYNYIILNGNFSVGDIVGYRWWANDSADNLNVTPMQSFTVRNLSFYMQLWNGTQYNDGVTFPKVNWTNQIINNSGVFEPAGQDSTHPFYKLNSTGDVVIDYHIYVNTTVPTGMNIYISQTYNTANWIEINATNRAIFNDIAIYNWTNVYFWVAIDELSGTFVPSFYFESWEAT